MILNENLDVNGVDGTVRRAFLHRPEKILLKPPARLYKWTNRRALAERDLSPWWSFAETTPLPSGAIAEGFRIAEERAHRLQRSHREFARSRAAISDRFGNTMQHLIVVQLTTPAWGLAGQASGQPEFAEARGDLGHVFLIGGAYQVWIPNLTRRHVQEVPTLG